MSEDQFANLQIYEFVAEDFKKLRIFRVETKGESCIQLTGPEGAGKTSVVDAIWFMLKGAKGLPVKAVRTGAAQMRVSGRIGNEDIEFKITRTMSAGAAEPQPPKIEMIKGTRDTTNEKFLGQFFDLLTFDPLEFLHMSPKDQIAKLRETAHVDLDFEALDKDHKLDYEARAKLKSEAKDLAARIEATATIEGLPKEKFDEDAIVKKLEEAGEAYQQAQEISKAKQALGAKAATARVALIDHESRISGQKLRIEAMERELEEMRGFLKRWEDERTPLALAAGEAQANYEAAPEGNPPDVNALTAELQSAQRNNRAIDQWRAKEALKRELAAKEQQWSVVDNRMAARDEHKRVAVANAKMPIDGLVFNESMTEVRYKGLPLENLSGGEAIRLSARIAMAANPKLRVLCIRNGEALDSKGFKILCEMAKENKFQIWITRAGDGRAGIVLEDGMVVKRNEEPPAEAEG